MIPTLNVSVKDFDWIPFSTLQLINIGRYTFYKIKIKEFPQIEYLLRTGMNDFYFLDQNGKTFEIKNIEENIELKNKIKFFNLESIVKPSDIGF